MKRSHFHIFCTILFFLLTYFSIDNSNAGIYFLSKSDSVQAQNYTKPCALSGYTKTDAECKKSGLKLINTCPTDGRYGKSCGCDESQFPYTTANCASPKKPSGDTCNGKYKTCDCDPAVYKYSTNSNCPQNQIIDTKKSCTFANNKVAYSACVCASQYSETCSGNLEGVGEACGGKYMSCKCKSNFISCNGQKGASGSTSCVDSTGTKYTSCQPETCESGGYVSTIPTNNNCTTVSYSGLTCYKDCKAKTCADGGYVSTIPTNNNCTTVSYSGLTCYKDCKAKTCADGGYVSSIPSGQTCTAVSYSGLTCYKNCSVSVCYWNDIIDYGANSKCKKWNCAGGDLEGEVAPSVSGCKTKCTASTQPNCQCSPCCIMALDGFSDQIDMCQ